MNTEISRANKLYSSSIGTKSSLSQETRKENLQQALSIYHTQLSKIYFELHSKKSIWKNIGVTNLRLADLWNPQSDILLVMHHLSECVRYLTLAWLSGLRTTSTTVWMDRVEELALEFLASVMSRICSVTGCTTALQYGCAVLCFMITY
jgi:hypothetical protein